MGRGIRKFSKAGSAPSSGLRPEKALWEIIDRNSTWGRVMTMCVVLDGPKPGSVEARMRILRAEELRRPMP
jgi:hypothetical protein